MGRRVSLDHLEKQGRVDSQDQRENQEKKERREMLEKMAPKVMREKRVTQDHRLQELRENLENLVVQDKRVSQGCLDYLDSRGSRENQASLVLKESRAYQGYQEQKVNVERQGLLEEVNEETREPQDQRVIVETKETLELWGPGVHLGKREIQELLRS